MNTIVASSLEHVRKGCIYGMLGIHLLVFFSSQLQTFLLTEIGSTIGLTGCATLHCTLLRFERCVSTLLLVSQMFLFVILGLYSHSQFCITHSEKHNPTLDFHNFIVNLQTLFAVQRWPTSSFLLQSILLCSSKSSATTGNLLF